VIQEVADLGAITHLVILWDDFEQRSDQVNSHYRNSHSYDSDTTRSPQLVITYTAPTTATTLPAVSIAMDKDEVTSGSFRGNLTILGSPNPDGWFEYGLTVAYGSSTANISYNSTGVKTVSIPNNLTAGETYHFRFAAQNIEGASYGADDDFTLTMPTVVTNSATNVAFPPDGTTAILNANITDLGVASDTYAYLEWGKTTSYGIKTTIETKNATGTYSATITGFAPDTTYHYRAVNRIGITSVYSYGADSTFSSPANASFRLNMLLPLIFSAMIIFVVVVIMRQKDTPLVIGIILVAIAIYVGLGLLQVMNDLMSILF